MQRMKQLTSGAFLFVLAASGLAVAGEPTPDQGGRNSQPAPRTGSGAHGSDSTGHAGDSSQASAPKTAADRNAPSASSDLSQRAGDDASQHGWAREMDRGQIAQLQRELAARGAYQGPVDGVAGPQTMAALRRFQQQQGLPTQAGLDQQTRQALGLQLDRQPVSGAQTSASPELDRPVGRESAVTGGKTFRSQVPLETLSQDHLRMVQTRLQELGFYQGPVDGVSGQGTRSAVQRFFQTQAELASRGMISDVTASVFGLSPRDLEPAVGAATQMGVGPKPGQGTNASPSSTGTTPDATDRGAAARPSGTTTPQHGTMTPPRQGTGAPQGGTGAPQGGTGSPQPPQGPR